MAPAVAGGVIAYEDLFEVIDQDPDGKKFDKVSRFRCRSQFEAELQIDINVDIYKLEVGTKFTLVLAPTLSLNGTPEDTSFDQSGEESLADAYEYVMYGKVFKKEDTDEGGIAKAAVNISFGGLLLHLKAEPKNLQDVEIDNRVYVLIRKIK